MKQIQDKIGGFWVDIAIVHVYQRGMNKLINTLSILIDALYIIINPQLMPY